MNAYFAGEVDESPRDRFFYVNDDAELVALRVGDWKFIFKEQRAHAARDLAGARSSSCARPRSSTSDATPSSARSTDSNTYYDWMIDRIYMIVPAQAAVAEAIQEFEGVPAAAEAGVVQPGDRVLEKLQEGDRQPELTAPKVERTMRTAPRTSSKLRRSVTVAREAERRMSRRLVVMQRRRER